MPTTITVIGRLGKDAEIKDVNGKRVMELTIADNYKASGKEETIWRKATFWDDTYRKLEQYLTKGSLLSVTGEDKPARIYNSNGEDKVALSMTGKMVQFIPTGKKQEESGQTSTPQAKPMYQKQDLYPPC